LSGAFSVENGLNKEMLDARFEVFVVVMSQVKVFRVVTVLTS